MPLTSLTIRAPFSDSGVHAAAQAWDDLAMADPHVLAPGLAPSPFSADEIRDGCPAGRTIELLVEPADGAPFVRVNRFARCDEDGALIERWRVSADGSVDGTVDAARSTWLDLQRHASFPADATTIEDDILDLPMGLLCCLRYTVGTGSGRTVFWFARDLPGMPVRYEAPAESGGTDRTTMTSSRVVRET